MRRAARTAVALLSVLAWHAPVAGQGGDAGMATGATSDGADDPVAALTPEERPEVRMALSREEVGLGELLALRIEASAREGDDVTVTEQDFAPFELHDRKRIVRPAKNGRQVFVFELSLQTFEPSASELSPIALRVVTADGVVGEVSTPAQAVRITSLLQNEPDAKPRPPGEPVSVMEDDYTLLWVLGALLAIALIALLTLLVQRYLRNRPQPLPPAPPPRPPWEVATEKLAALRRRKAGMLEAGQGVQLVDEVSDVVREYLGHSFGFEGLDTTTEEMLRMLRHRGANAEIQARVQRYLGRCDLVKFADVNPDQDEAEDIFARAEDFVREGTPAIPTRPEGRAPAGEGTSS